MPRKQSAAKKIQPRKKSVPPPPPPPPPPFDPGNLDAWLNHITDNAPLFIKILCRSLYYENLLVRLARRATLCDWGMTSQGRFPMFPENDPLWGMDHLPPPQRMLPAGDEQFDAMVRQEDQGEPAAPRACAAAAFKYAGGNVPEPTPNVGNWKLLHLYPSLDRIVLGDLESIAVAAAHFTQSANMVAVHPLVHQSVADYPCILSVLQARMFTAFDVENRYDPERKFAPGENHDLTGFVWKRQPAA